MREEPLGSVWRVSSRLAIEVDFGGEVGIKGVLETLRSVSCLYRLQIPGRVECATD